MDPDACFCLLLEADAAMETDQVYEHAKNLREWLDKGGFYPGGGKLRESSIDTWVNQKIFECEAHFGH